MINFNCKDIIEYLDSKEHIPSDTKRYGTKTGIILDRTKDGWLFDLIESQLSPEYKIKDVFRGLIYKKGDYMSLHKDADFDDAYLSGGILLNEEYEGGEFIIEGKTLKVPIGELFTFGRHQEHEIKPIKSGIRYSLHFHIMLRESSII